MKYLSEALQVYVARHCPPEPPLLAELRRETHLKILYPQMISSVVQGRWLSMLSKLVSPTRILEIGAFSGYSTLCLAEGLAPNGKVISIEQNPEREALIQKYVEKAGIDQLVELRIGDAAALLPEVSGPFDLVFIDADKANYPLYFELVVPLLRPGGLLVADNVLWHGHVLSERKDKETVGIKGFNAAVMADDRVEGLLMGVEDGLFLVRKH